MRQRQGWSLSLHQCGWMPGADGCVNMGPSSSASSLGSLRGAIKHFFWLFSRFRHNYCMAMTDFMIMKRLFTKNVSFCLILNCALCSLNQGWHLWHSVQSLHSAMLKPEASSGSFNTTQTHLTVGKINNNKNKNNKKIKTPNQMTHFLKMCLQPSSSQSVYPKIFQYA